MEARVAELGELRLCGLRGVFAADQMPGIGGLWARFESSMGGLPGRKGSAAYGACLPTASGLEYTAAVEVEDMSRVPEGMVGFTLPPRRYAVFTHRGHIGKIGETWDAVWHRWLGEQSLRHLPGAHAFEKYDERWDPATGVGDVDLFVPLA